MKRLEDAVKGLSPKVLSSSFERLASALSPEELSVLNDWIRTTRDKRSCSKLFAFGILVRHLSGHLFPHSTEGYALTVEAIIERKSVAISLSPTN